MVGAIEPGIGTIVRAHGDAHRTVVPFLLVSTPESQAFFLIDRPFTCAPHDDLVPPGNGATGAVLGAFPAEVADGLHADVDRLIRKQG